MLLSVDDAFYNMLTAATSTHLKYITFLKHFRSVGEVKVCHILVGKCLMKMRWWLFDSDNSSSAQSNVNMNIHCGVWCMATEIRVQSSHVSSLSWTSTVKYLTTATIRKYHMNISDFQRRASCDLQ